MCGRYALSQIEGVPDFFEVSDVRIVPRFNIAPSQQAPVVRQTAEDRRELVNLRWGLIPHWSREPRSDARMINARAETLAQKPSFRDSFRSRRCLVPADAFFEWKKLPGNRKQPFCFRLKSGGLFAFAGLWDRYRGDDGILDSFTIVTGPPNELVANFHDRMPAILKQEDFTEWLRGTDLSGLRQRLLQPFEADALVAFPVSTLVNNPRNDRPECLEAVQ